MRSRDGWNADVPLFGGVPPTTDSGNMDPSDECEVRPVSFTATRPPKRTNAPPRHRTPSCDAKPPMTSTSLSLNTVSQSV
ncbi:MAG: hypothetical protein ACKVWV_13830 [Planctomycetota bacterium]